MEYLMTYGWAILIIAIVLAALFSLGVFNPMAYAPKAPPGACQVFRPNGPGTTFYINLEGICNGELPQYTMAFSNTSVHGVIVQQSPSMSTAWGGGSWTIATWFKETALLNASTGRDLIEENTGCTSGLWVGSSSVTQFSVFTIQWYSSGGACTNEGAVSAGYGGLPYNTWLFVVSTFHYNPGNSWVAICVNGVCNNSTWTSDSPSDYAQYGFTFSINDNDCCSVRSPGGELANVQLYNTSLSQQEIQALYREGIGGAPIDLQNLVGWWPLNGNANDYSGNGNNGELNNVVRFDGNWYPDYTPP
jgi:hypothetical protein